MKTITLEQLKDSKITVENTQLSFDDLMPLINKHKKDMQEYVSYFDVSPKGKFLNIKSEYKFDNQLLKKVEQEIWNAHLYEFKVNTIISILRKNLT